MWNTKVKLKRLKCVVEKYQVKKSTWNSLMLTKSLKVQKKYLKVYNNLHINLLSVRL